jgi:hypothetical protein
MENERELGWDDAIEKDSEYILLPDGDYDFLVTDLKRDRYPGGDKLPTCNRATVYLTIDTPEGQAVIQHQLFLHTKTEGLLCAFFKAIGHRESGEQLRMNWSRVVGSTGRAKIGKRIYNENEYNDIKKFLDPPPRQQPQQPQQPPTGQAYTPGQF